MTIPMKFQSAFAKFESAKVAVAAFEQENRVLIEEYKRLMEHREATESEVKLLYKENADAIGPKYGDFKVVRPTSVDVDRLLELCPDVEPYVVVEKKLNKKDFDMLQKNGTIPDSVASKVEVPGPIQIRNR